MMSSLMQLVAAKLLLCLLCGGAFGITFRQEQLSIVKSNMPWHIVRQLETPKRIIYCIELGSRSHVKPVLPILNELIERGHRVDYAAVLDVAFEWGEGTRFERQIRLKSTIEYNDQHNKTARSAYNNWFRNFRPNELETGVKAMTSWFQITLDRYEGLIMSMKEEFDNNRPDLFICDVVAFSCLDYARASSIPYVITSYMSAFPLFPRLPTFMPNVYTGQTPYSVTYWDRVINTFVAPAFQLYHLAPYFMKLCKMRTMLGLPPSSRINEVYKRKHIFVFKSYVLDIPRYASPFMHIVGPVAERNPKALDGDLRRWLDDIAARSSGESVVYMAVGTFTSLSPITVQKLVQGILFENDFSNLNGSFSTRKNVHLLWSIGKADPRQAFPEIMVQNPSAYNLRFMHWAPQSPQVDVLNHPAVRLFVTHGGIESIHECNYAAKPMLIVPGFSDQKFNAKRIKEIQVGDYLDKQFTAEEVGLKSSSLLLSYATNSTFRQHLETVAKLVYFYSQQYNHVADIMEMEMEVGSDHLHLPEDEWPFYRLYNIDLYLLPFGAALGFFFLMKACRRNKKSKLD